MANDIEKNILKCICLMMQGLELAKTIKIEINIHLVI